MVSDPAADEPPFSAGMLFAGMPPRRNSEDEAYLRGILDGIRRECLAIAAFGLTFVAANAFKLHSSPTAITWVTIGIGAVQFLVALRGGVRWNQGQVNPAEVLNRLDSLLRIRNRLRNAAVALLLIGLACLCIDFATKADTPTGRGTTSGPVVAKPPQP